MLDDPAWSALTGAHRGLAVRSGRAARYPAEVNPFAGLAARDADSLADLARLVPLRDLVALFADAGHLDDPHWRIVQRLEVIQMVCDVPVAPPLREPSALSSTDVPAMIALVDLTRPGPFGPRTIEMGRYLGFREGGRLVAMGGERLRPAGHGEVSAICTSPDFRGRGLAEAVVRALASSIQARGERPFLHVQRGSASEASAVSLYTRLGFREMRRSPLVVLQRKFERGEPSTNA